MSETFFNGDGMIEIVINADRNTLGDGINVRRTLPYEKKKMVGPFIFFDYICPVEITADHKFSVLPHPHTGLITLTYLFNGVIQHRDNLGNEQLIIPGEVNCMTAGRGIVHSERSHQDEGVSLLEGIQVWIALPREVEDIEASFKHISSDKIPVIESGKITLRLLAGRALGKVSPVPVYSFLFLLVGQITTEGIFSMDLDSLSEGAVYIVKGQLNCDHKIYEEGALICFQRGTSINFIATSDSQVVIFGGEVLPEKRYIWWNFVSVSESKIEMAKMRWNNNQFGKVINEDDKILLSNDTLVGKDDVVIYP